MLEIERKFLIDGFPIGLELLRDVEIEQGYICIKPEVRIHKAVDNTRGRTDYRMTLKDNGDLTRTEVETDISGNFYYDAMGMLGVRPIVKEYKAYKLGPWVLEVCRVDADTQNEFYYAEIEFPTEVDAKNFVPPKFLGREITYNDDYKMKNYWKRTRL